MFFKTRTFSEKSGTVVHARESLYCLASQKQLESHVRLCLCFVVIVKPCSLWKTPAYAQARPLTKYRGLPEVPRALRGLLVYPSPLTGDTTSTLNVFLSTTAFQSFFSLVLHTPLGVLFWGRSPRSCRRRCFLGKQHCSTCLLLRLPTDWYRGSCRPHHCPSLLAQILKLEREQT